MIFTFAWRIIVDKIFPGKLVNFSEVGIVDKTKLPNYELRWLLTFPECYIPSEEFIYPMKKGLLIYGKQRIGSFNLDHTHGPNFAKCVPAFIKVQ